jgi:hypothetical protein
MRESSGYNCITGRRSMYRGISSAFKKEDISISLFLRLSIIILDYTIYFKVSLTLLIMFILLKIRMYW